MIFTAPKFVLLFAVAMLAANPAHAAILRSSNGMPVLTKDGSCVTTGWQGGEDCEAAKAAAGLGSKTSEVPAKTENTQDKTVYFKFNQSALTAPAKNRLDHVVKELHAFAKRKQAPQAITIVGYADRIGNADYNKKLALKRAEAVRAYLLSKGVQIKIALHSVGKTEPRAECSADLPHAKLIRCLRTDRRVEIDFTK
jgi:OOP family OmpA-OmpF porin